ncbi:MAG: HAMP domain-containing protein [Candidatus Omnitrophica bacterium]|nr:HAMP domain-containing protein [Candidatus Omnitrophota bacterium]
MLINSIYFRMTFWYVLALGLISGILSISLYANFSRVLNKDFNHLLESRAQDIAQVMDELSDRRDAGLPADLSHADVASTLHNAVEWSRGDGLFIQVFSQDGRELIHSSNKPFSLALRRAALSAAAERFEDIPGVSLVKEEDVWPFRTYVLPINKKVNVYYVQITASLRPVYVKLGRIKTVLLIFLPLAMVLVTIMGIFLTRATLKPVDHMTRTMRQITSRNLKQRIKIPTVNDETRRLAETFNDMLTRLDYAFSFQQQLVQDVSHELRTPLTVLKGKQEVALNRRRTPEEYEAVLTVNLEEIDKMNELVDGLLTLAQLERVEHRLELQKVNITGLIKGILRDARSRADLKKIELRLLASDEFVIDADEGQLRRAVANMVDNAIKYTLESGQISVRVSRHEGMAEVTINDTGVGIAKEDLERVFSRFFRAEKSRTSPGFGLGLSIVKAIVSAHQGTVRAESEPGQGSTFIIMLPVSHG